MLKGGAAEGVSDPDGVEDTECHGDLRFQTGEPGGEWNEFVARFAALERET